MDTCGDNRQRHGHSGNVPKRLVVVGPVNLMMNTDQGKDISGNKFTGEEGEKQQFSKVGCHPRFTFWSLFEKLIHNAIRPFTCYNFEHEFHYFKYFISTLISCKTPILGNPGVIHYVTLHSPPLGQLTDETPFSMNIHNTGEYLNS